MDVASLFVVLGLILFLIVAPSSTNRFAPIKVKARRLPWTVT